MGGIRLTTSWRSPYILGGATIVLLLHLLSTLVLVDHIVALTPAEEKQVLLDYIADMASANQSWTSVTDMCSDWPAIVCESDGHVIELDLVGNADLLTGTIPVQLSSLSRLQGIIFDDNVLSGTLPEEWSYLTNLVYMDMWKSANGYTGLHGTLPPQWSAMAALEEMNLEGNDCLDGTLPPEWSALAALRILNIDTDVDNRSNKTISGKLPEQWSAMTDLEILNLQSSHVSGTLPEQWSNMIHLNLL